MIIWIVLKRLNKSLPSKDKFYTSLTRKSISDKNYDLVVKVWNTMKVENTKQYYNLYLACDVLLLADLFERFRNTCIDYKLDSTHYLSQDAMLKMTGVKVKFISEIDMYQYVEKSVSGGISYISQKVQ